MAIAICSKCGSHIEYEMGEEFAYCPICECDQVEIKNNYTQELSEELNQKYSHLDVEAFTNPQKEALKIIDGLKERYKKITDLEAKLAESEKKAITYVKEIVFLDKKLENLNKEFELAQEHNEKTVEYWKNECSQLKHQLSEKEKEIKQLKLDLGMFKSVNEFINNYGIDKAREVLLQSEKTKKQDKIEFAVEHLEKVKNNILSNITFGIESVGIMNGIDNQIKQLKEGK